MALWGKTDTFAGRPKYTSPAKFAFDASSASVVSTSNNTIVSKRHKFQTGEGVIYSAGGGTVITGLVEGTTYYVIRVDQDTIKLASSVANALVPTPISLTGLGVGTAHQLAMASIYFVDATEAALASNHNKGINGAGWWRVKEYTDSDGNPRYKSELLVAMNETAASAGDASDNTTVPNAESVITISVQPVAQSTTVALSAATFAVTAAASTGTIAYQWQKAFAATPNKFTNFSTGTNVTGFTAASLVFSSGSGLVVANTGDRYRVVISNNAGAVKVVSNAVTLTVAP